MGLFKTLEDLKEATKREVSGSTRNFFSIKAGQNYRIRFLQELTEDGKNFDEDLGTGLVVPVHVAPHDFKKKLACSLEDDALGRRCWAHEQAPYNKKWRATPHLVINVAVSENEVWTPRILDQTFSPKHVMSTLVEYAANYGTITDRYYKIGRIGSGPSDTNYTLIPLEEAKITADIAALELNELDGVYRKLPYDDQEEYFMSEVAKEASASGW